MESPMKENLKIFGEIRELNKVIPNLKIYNSLRESLSPTDTSSLSSRMKRRIQVQKSLDFTLTKCTMKTSKVVKATHDLNPSPTITPPIVRKTPSSSQLPVKSRPVSKNIFLDHFPLR